MVYIKLYFRYFGLYFRSLMQYKASFILTCIAHFSMSFTAFLSILFMFNRFNTINGFTFEQVLICYANVTLCFAFSEFFARGFDLFDRTIANGDFDRILVRPQHELFGVLVSEFDLSRIGSILQAIVIYCYALPQSGITWTVDKIAVQVLTVVCGMTFFCALFLIFASICFFSTKSIEAFNILTYGSKEHGQYPMAIYGEKILKFFTYVIPLACIQYYPLLYLTDSSNRLLYALSPLYAMLLIIPAYIFWKFGVKHFKSTGS